MECKRCGNCCKSVVINVKVDMADRDAEDFVKFLEMHGMKAVYNNNTIAVMVYAKCENLIEKNGGTVCDIYENRPKICREYSCGE